MIHPARHTSLAELLEDAFHTYPSDEAVIEAERDRENARLTYREVWQRTQALAAWLAERGVGADDRVALAAGNQHRWLVAAAAALHLGCTLVPLDARLEPHELAALLRHSGAKVLVVDAHILRKLPEDPELTLVLGSRPGQELGAAVPFDEAVAEGPVPRAPRTRNDVACLVYSSGTGGTPKGCRLTHGNYLAQYQALMETFTWNRGDRYLSILPTNHAIDFMCGFLATFATGGCVVHQRTLRPEFILSAMRRYRPAQMAVVPLLLEAFQRAIDEKLDEQPEGRRRAFDALVRVNTALTRRAPNHGVSRWLLKPVHDGFGGNLRTIFCGGAFTDRALAERFAELGLPVAIGYGLTEACTVLTVNDLKPFRGDSVGAPVPGVRVRIASPGPEGIGEVEVSGPTVFAGYEDADDLTEAAFTDDGWLRTGDLGWLDGAHHLHLVGRSRNMIVTPGGKNVYPEDLEHAFSGVDAEELCIFASDYVFGGGTLGAEALVAVVRADGEREPLRDALRRANRRLPEHKRVDGVIWWEDEFPRTTSLKVKRIVLAETLRSTRSRDDVEVLA